MSKKVRSFRADHEDWRLMNELAEHLHCPSISALILYLVREKAREILTQQQNDDGSLPHRGLFTPSGGNTALHICIPTTGDNT